MMPHDAFQTTHFLITETEIRNALRYYLRSDFFMVKKMYPSIIISLAGLGFSNIVVQSSQKEYPA
jgi:hypothetical protein